MVAPKGWTEVQLGELLVNENASIKTGPFGTVLKASEFVKYGTPIVSVREIRSGYIKIFDETPCLSSNTIKRLSKYILKNNDLVFARKGSVDRCAIIKNMENGYFLGSDAIRLRLISNRFYPKFILYYLHSHTIQNYLIQNSYGTTMAGLNEKILASLPLQYPESYAEQYTIAETLSDVDSLIDSLHKLIAKKKAIKQGAMQELLTGKKRLPGFKGEWKIINLADKSKLKARIGWQGLTTAEYLPQGFAYLITGTDFKCGKIDWSRCCFVDEKRYAQDSNIQIKNGDVLITKDGTIGKIAYIQKLSYPTTLNSGVFVIRPIHHTAYFSEFLYHIMDSFIFEKFLMKLSAGSTINHLYQKDFALFSFYAPPTLKEQTAIAQILSDMDIEIDQLTKKLSKYQHIKQGMMQALLTGRIRLVDTDTNAQPQKSVQPRKHSQQFDDAVMIAGIVDAFYSEKYFLGRKKVQKLLYFCRRQEQADTSAFLKKAAGPYADSIRYKGGEPVARNSGYIAIQQNDKGSCFSRGPKFLQALEYLETWGKQPVVDWLVSMFKYTKVDELELLATIDMAMCDLRDAGKDISVQAIKELIVSSKEWRDKLKKVYFSDEDIQRAITKCRELFGEQ